MLRRLIMMRHAKSAWDTDAPSDHARPLNKRGRRDAPRVGAHLAERGWLPEVVLSSDSARTRETWERMSAAFDRVEVCFLPTLYAAGVGEVAEALRRVPDQIGTVLMLGHNPGWEEVVERLTGAPVLMTTANAALLELEAESWAQAASSDGWRMEAIIRPKELGPS